MRFIDEATITVSSGNGGHGCLSFRREKFIPKGGPDGGDGGKGGDVIFQASAHKRTLYRFRHQTQFKAPNGAPGQGRQKTGRGGADLIIPVPPGTLIKDSLTQTLLADLVQPGQQFIAARGGRGGRGNTRFKTSTNRAPRHTQPGEKGETGVLQLELKLLADVGLIGLPNAGKSTLITALSAARPKIADYPFTTLVPSLGVVDPGEGEPYVIADIPGLISGAHQGAGLGIRFLRHVERTRILLHLIDAAAIDPEAPLASYDTINDELTRYDTALARKPQLVVLNKLDLPAGREGAEAFRAAWKKNEPLIRISAVTRKGLERLGKKLAQRVYHRDDTQS
ncbi:MAG: GTPase ObgE [Desulfobacterales bacterium]